MTLTGETFHNKCVFERKTKQHVVFIYGIKYESFRRFLGYVYTGVFEVEAPHAFEVLQLAQYFEFENLKILCAKVLQRSIDVDSVIPTLLLAAESNLLDLKAYCMAFITEFRSEVTPLLKRGVKQLTPELLREVKHALSQHITSPPPRVQNRL